MSDYEFENVRRSSLKIALKRIKLLRKTLQTYSEHILVKRGDVLEWPLKDALKRDSEIKKANT